MALLALSREAGRAGLTRTVAPLSAWQFPSLPWASAHHQSLVSVCHLVPQTYMDPLMVLASP